MAELVEKNRVTGKSEKIALTFVFTPDDPEYHLMVRLAMKNISVQQGIRKDVSKAVLELGEKARKEGLLI